MKIIFNTIGGLVMLTVACIAFMNYFTEPHINHNTGLVVDIWGRELTRPNALIRFFSNDELSPGTLWNIFDFALLSAGFYSSILLFKLADRFNKQKLKPATTRTVKDTMKELTEKHGGIDDTKEMTGKFSVRIPVPTTDIYEELAEQAKDRMEASIHYGKYRKRTPPDESKKEEAK